MDGSDELSKEVARCRGAWEGVGQDLDGVDGLEIALGDCKQSARRTSCAMENDNLLRVSCTLWDHFTMPAGLLDSAVVGTIMLAWPNEGGWATVARLGDNAGSELGGEPNPAALTFTMDPQWKTPGSDGGVTTGTTRSTLALAGRGLVVMGV